MFGMKKGADMRRKRQSSPTVPRGYADAWLRLFTPPADPVEPAHTPRLAGSRKASVSAPQRTQPAPAVSLHHPDKGARKS